MLSSAQTRLLVAALSSAFGVECALAASAARPQSPDAALTQRGQMLEQRYATELAALQTELRSLSPKVGDRQRAEHLAVRADEHAAMARLAKAEAELGAVQTARGLVDHAKGKWIGGADHGIAKAEQMLAKATTPAERRAADAERAKWQENRREGLRALAERQSALDEAVRAEPQRRAAAEAARKQLEAARDRTRRSLDDLGLDALLSRDALDARLAKFVVLYEATPKGLAAFAQAGLEQEALVTRLLADDDLMLRMVAADGANGGRYGEAMAIHAAIEQQVAEPKREPLRRLALAIALEHAVPVKQRNAEAATGAPSHVDPVARYLHYERAFLAGELDPGFAGLSTWDYRMVVDGEEPDEILAWGRQMLRDYRPDHVFTSDYRWRYVAAVRTDIRYGSDENQHDRSDLQFFQNILMNGGVCGRRAFFGRFILRAFGIPTTARPQRGHAALVHWTPDGWVPCLGAGWGSGWTRTRYGQDLDFLATTQARALGDRYLQVQRARWIGDVMGEKRTFGLLAGEADFWHGVALHLQRSMIADGAKPALAPVGEELAEANESAVEYATEAAKRTDADRIVVVGADGVIVIPAVACSSPAKSTAKIVFLPSSLGGKQLHYSGNGADQDFEYTFEAPRAGVYELTARVVTPSWKQHVLVAANGGAPVDIALPFTVGRWGDTEPVRVELAAGRNVLRFTRKGAPHDVAVKGFSVRDWTLTPVP